MREVLDHYLPRIRASTVLGRLGLEPRKYFVVSAHREENVDSPSILANLLDALNGLLERYGFPVIVSTHPRTRATSLAVPGPQRAGRRIAFSGRSASSIMRTRQLHAFCVLSDSARLPKELAAELSGRSTHPTSMNARRHGCRNAIYRQRNPPRPGSAMRSHRHAESTGCQGRCCRSPTTRTLRVPAGRQGPAISHVDYGERHGVVEMSPLCGSRDCRRLPATLNSGAVQVRDLAHELASPQGHEVTVLVPAAMRGAPWAIHRVGQTCRS